MTLNSPPVRLKIAIVLLLCVAIALRLSHLDIALWHDEIVTVLHAVGYHKINFFEYFPRSPGEIVTVAQLQQYRYPQPETNWLNTIAVLAHGEPQNPPLYYLFLRWWVQIFGSSITAYRSLSVTVSLFLFPATYWLAWELFRSRTIAWVAMGIVAVAPIHFRYALEVRPYVLWTVAIAISSALFLRACRLQKQILWRGNAVSVILGLYTFPFTIFVSISHGIYIIFIDKLPLTKRGISYLKACAISFAAFLPWILCLFTINSDKMGEWRKTPMPKQELYNNWISHISFTFLFRDYPDTHYFSSSSYFFASVSVLIAAFCVFAVYYCLRRLPSPSAVFLGALMVVTAGFLIVPDLISGGIRSIVERYCMPCYLGIQLSIAYLLTDGIYAVSQHRWRQKLWILVAILLLSLATISYTKKDLSYGRSMDAIDSIVNQSDNPLLVAPWTRHSVLNVISLSQQLDRDTQIVFLPRTRLSEIPDDREDVFLFFNVSELELEAETELKLKTVDQKGSYRLMKVTSFPED